MVDAYLCLKIVLVSCNDENDGGIHSAYFNIVLKCVFYFISYFLLEMWFSPFRVIHIFFNKRC